MTAVVLDIKAKVRADAARPVRFLAVGVWNTVFGYVAFAACWAAVSAAGLPYLAAAAPAHVLAVTNAYLCHRYFVFGGARRVSSSLPRFVLVQLVTFGLSVALLALLVSGAGLHPLLAQVFVLALMAFGSYAAHARFSFAAEE